jgi:hypothetical protein
MRGFGGPSKPMPDMLVVTVYSLTAQPIAQIRQIVHFLLAWLQTLGHVQIALYSLGPSPANHTRSQ